MRSYLKTWCLNKDLKHIISLPVLVFWFTWKARNLRCFEDSLILPIHVSSLCLGMLSSFTQINIVVNIIFVVEETIDKTFPWGYFDGSASGEPKICGPRGILYFTDDHFFTFKAGLGSGTNNYA